MLELFLPVKDLEPIEHMVPWPTRVYPSGISIGSAAFPQHTLVTNGQTDRTNTEFDLYRLHYACNAA